MGDYSVFQIFTFIDKGTGRKLFFNGYLWLKSLKCKTKEKYDFNEDFSRGFVFLQ